MEDDNQDGPFAVWQMFNAPTMVLFNNLHHAADGLERLLTSILKLSGDFSEVLVPRPGSSKYPDTYYKAFNTWLIGRLYYVWTVNELERIHTTGKEAQLKIISTLCANNASFYEEIHFDYINITKTLIECYKSYINDLEFKEITLKYFVSENVEIPNVQLNLEPIFACVKNAQTCVRLIDLSLGLLSESLPINYMNINRHLDKCNSLFVLVLELLEISDVNTKIICIHFFTKLTENFNKFLLESFQDKFNIIFIRFIEDVEAMVTTLAANYDKGLIDENNIKDFNKELIKILQLIKNSLTYHETFETLCSVILIRNNETIFNKEIVLFCLSASCDLSLQEDLLNIQNRDFTEINALLKCYSKNILSDIRTQMEDKYKENWYYRQVINVIKSVGTCLQGNVEDFIVVYNLRRLRAVLNILEYVCLQAEIQKQSIVQFLNKNEIETMFQCIKNLLTSKKHLFESEDNSKLMFEILFAIFFVVDRKQRFFEEKSHLLFLRNSLQVNIQTVSQKNVIRVEMLNYFTASALLVKFPLDDAWIKRITSLVVSLLKTKSTNDLKLIIPMSPLLCISKVLSESKIIAEILLPALLKKDSALQKQLSHIIPAICCMSFEKCKVILLDSSENCGHVIFESGSVHISVICYKCHKSKYETMNSSLSENRTVLSRIQARSGQNDTASVGLKSLFAKFLNCKIYSDIKSSGFHDLVTIFSNHGIVNVQIAQEIFNGEHELFPTKFIKIFVNNIMEDGNIEFQQKDALINICVKMLVQATKKCLESNDYELQTKTLDCIKEFGYAKSEKVVLPSTNLTVYFIMHPQCSLAPKAVVYLRDICEAHDSTPNQVYHRYKNDYCRLFVDCSLYNGKEFALSLLKVVLAFGFVGYRDFISKDVHHFLPYLIPYSVKIKEVPHIVQEIASLVQCSVSDFLVERFPHVYTHIYLYETEQVSKKCFELLERMTKMSILNLIKRHFRVILTEFLLQYCCNAEKVLNACRYLACHDPDVSTPNGSMNMTTSQIADFLHPKFLGILAYFDHKLVNTKVALSVKRKALQSFPEIMKLMGVQYLTPLRYKVLATLRSALSLVKEFPKILAAAWSGFIHNIDTIALGPLLPNLAISLLPQLEDAPHEINKIFQYLVLNNENLLSSNIPDLFFLEDSKISDKVKLVIKRHVKRTQPESFLDKVRWYLKHLNQEIPTIRAYAFSNLDQLIKENRSEINKAIFGGKTIDPILVELIDSLLTGCKDADSQVSLSSGACLGQLCAIEAAHLPRQYVQDRSPFAFSISDDCFAATALFELTRAFQYEKDTLNMNSYALTIQEILKIYNISPTGSKQEIWDSFPEHMHQIMYPLLSSRYTLAYPSQPKKTHPLFGSSYATSFLEWAHNWAGQLIPLIESESIRELLRTVHPSMRRDVRTLFLFLPYVLLHAVMAKSNPLYIQEEVLAVIGLESFVNDNRTSDKARYKILRHVRMTPTVSSVQAEEGNQTKCSKMIYTLLDFLNRWLLEWCHSKQHPLQNENYKAISSFLQKFDKLTIARGNFMSGEFERALQYLELYMDEYKDKMQEQLPFLAEIYALLDEPDSVAGILSLKRSEPSLKELILAQVVTGRLQDAALCYERVAQEGQLDKHSLQGMIDCYLGLDQPFTAFRLLSEHMQTDSSMAELTAEPLWRLGRFEELDRLVKKPLPATRENWGLLMGRILLSYRSQDHADFQAACQHGMTKLLAQLDGEAKGENALRSGYQTVLGLHIIKEAEHVEEVFRSLKSKQDGVKQSAVVIDNLLEDWRRRLSMVQSDVRTVEPLLRLRRILLQQTQELLQTDYPMTSEKLKSCVGDLWLQSAKHARKAGIFQQSYMYILNAEEYQPQELFIEKAKMYWARGQKEQAFTTLKRGLEESYPELDKLTQSQRKISAKAKLLIAKYNDETTSVDVDVNIGYYKDAVDAFKQWEKSLVCLGAYYEKVSTESPSSTNATWSRRVYALNSYGKALQYGHKYLYQSMPRMLSIWLDVEVTSADPSMHTVLAQMTDIIKTYSERLPLYLYLTAFSQIVSRICHPVKEVYLQLKAIIVKLIIAYPQHTLWMMMSVIKSSYPQRIKRCQDVFTDPRLKEPHMLKLVCDFTQLAEKLIELCNKPISGSSSTTTVTSLVRTLPRLLTTDSFSHIMMPFQEFCKIVLPSKAARQERIDFDIPAEPPVYIAGIEEQISILPSLQKPRKVTLKGSDGKPYIIMLKPRDDLRKDYRLMEFNGVVNRFLQDAPETRRRRLYIRTYSVLPLNEECGLIEWVPNLLGLRPILMHIYKQKGIHTSNRELKEMMCANKDPVEKKRRIFEEQLLPRHPPVFHEWFRRIFSDPYGWYQARSAYIRTTAVMSMVGYILGLGDRHGENISFDSTNGDTVHVDFNCLFNKGEAFEWPERVPFRLTHNMEAAMGPLKHEGMFRKSCEAVMSALRAQTAALMSVIGPFVYDPLVSWGRARLPDSGERTNEQALQHLQHIRQRLNGMVKTKNKQLSLSLSPEGQVEHLIVEATSIHNLSQMYIGWGPFL